MPVRPLAYRLAPQVLAVSALIASANWYLRPEATRSWLATMIFLGVMAVVYVLALDWRDTAVVQGAAPRQAAHTIVTAIVFSGLMVGSASLARLAAALGTLENTEVGTRAAMALFGAFLMFTGNAYAKALPVGACAGARRQALQRLIGWTWVVVGLAYALVWLRLPIDLAEIVGTGIILGGVLFVLTHAIRRLGRPHSI